MRNICVCVRVRRPFPVYAIIIEIACCVILSCAFDMFRVATFHFTKTRNSAFQNIVVLTPEHNWFRLDFNSGSGMQHFLRPLLFSKILKMTHQLTCNNEANAPSVCRRQ